MEIFHPSKIIEREKAINLFMPELGREEESTLRFLEALKTYPPEVWENLKFYRALAILEFAKHHSLFYKERFRDVEIGDIKSPEDLACIPPITKEDLVTHTQEWQEQRSAGSPFPETSFMTRPPHEGYSFWFTGGSTGYRTVSIRGIKEWDIYVNAAAELIYPHYFRQGEMVGVLINPASGWSGAQVFGEITRRSFQIGSTQLFMTDGAEGVLETMKQMGVTALFTQPENVTHPTKGLLAALAKNPNLSPPLWKKIVYGGSPLLPEQITMLTEMGYQVRPIYSQTEAGPIGVVPFDMEFQYDSERVFYIPTPLSWFYTLKRPEDPHPRIVVTNLIYTIAPVVHYENRDMAEWTTDKWNGWPIFAFYGRIPEDMVIGSLKIRDTFLAGPILEALRLANLSTVSPQIQVRQTPQGDKPYLIKIVLFPSSTSVSKEKLLRFIKNHLEKVWQSQGMGGDFAELMSYCDFTISFNPQDLLEKHGTGKVPIIVKG